MHDPASIHVPVLAEEILELLDPQPGQILVDGTLGGGGHTRLLAPKLVPGGRLLAIDRDPAAVARAEQELTGLPVLPIWGSYADVPEIVQQQQLDAVDGVLLDLGLSSDQLADEQRGFSFNIDAPLDLRFNPQRGEPAWRLIERLSEQHLADLIYHYGEERYSRRIARAIVQVRRTDPIRRSQQLAELVRRAVPRKGRDRIDPATRTFQALRIAVNDELKTLEIALRRLPEILRPGGKLAIISFHSLEDRPVKQAFRDDPRLEVLTRKPVRPGELEIARNPRSRSAKLRVAKRLPDEKQR